MFPERGWGVFASANAMFDAFAFYRDFGRALGERWLPAPRPPRAEPAPGFAERAARYTGTYVPNRRIRGDFMKLGQLVLHARVAANGEGGLTVTAPGFAERLVEVEPGLFRFADEERWARFFVDPKTGVEHLVLGSFLTLDRMPWWRSPRAHLLAGGAAALLLAGTLAGWTIGAAARRLAGAPPSPTPLLTRWLGAVVALLLLFGLAVIASELGPEHFADLLIAVPGRLRAGFAALTLGALLAPPLAWLALRGPRPGAHAPLARLHLLALAAAALLLAAQAAYWNVLGAALV
jgi:hypothetical protein